MPKLSIQSVEKMGELLCEAIHFIKKSGLSNPILDKADDVCKVLLPDLDTMSLTSSAMLAETAYDVLKRVRTALGG